MPAAAYPYPPRRQPRPRRDPGYAASPQCHRGTLPSQAPRVSASAAHEHVPDRQLHGDLLIRGMRRGMVGRWCCGTRPARPNPAMATRNGGAAPQPAPCHGGRRQPRCGPRRPVPGPRPARVSSRASATSPRAGSSRPGDHNITLGHLVELHPTNISPLTAGPNAARGGGGAASLIEAAEPSE